MEKILLTGEGFFYCYFDEESQNWIEKDASESTLPISWYLPMQVEFGEGLTVKNFLETFAKYQEQLNFVYAHALKTLTMEDIDKIVMQGDPSSQPSNLTATCLVWVGEIFDRLDEDIDLNINSALVGLDSEDPEEDLGADDVYQLTNFDFAEWCKLPLIMDDYLDFMRATDEKEALGGIYRWTLHDVFTTIFSEISLNLFVAGLVQHPDVEVHSPKMGIEELFNFLDGLDDDV